MKTNSKALNSAVYAENIEDIIFEGRNHLYGAYYLRKRYNNHLLKSLLTVLFFASIVIGIPLIRSFLFPKENIEPILKGGDGTVIIQNWKEDVPPPTPHFEKEVFEKLASVNPNFDPIVVDDVPVGFKGLDMNDNILDDPNDLYPANIKFMPVTDQGNEIDHGTGPKEQYEVDEPAEFKFGSFNKWLGENIKYNQDAVDAHITGQLIVRFTIDEEGKVTDVRVEKSLNPLLDQAAVEAVKKSPKWRAAKHNGYKVKTIMRVPLKFVVE